MWTHVQNLSGCSVYSKSMGTVCAYMLAYTDGRRIATLRQYSVFVGQSYESCYNKRATGACPTFCPRLSSSCDSGLFTGRVKSVMKSSMFKDKTPLPRVLPNLKNPAVVKVGSECWLIRRCPCWTFYLFVHWIYYYIHTSPVVTSRSSVFLRWLWTLYIIIDAVVFLCVLHAGLVWQIAFWCWCRVLCVCRPPVSDTSSTLLHVKWRWWPYVSIHRLSTYTSTVYLYSVLRKQ